MGNFINFTLRTKRITRSKWSILIFFLILLIDLSPLMGMDSINETPTEQTQLITVCLSIKGAKVVELEETDEIITLDYCSDSDERGVMLSSVAKYEPLPHFPIEIWKRIFGEVLDSYPSQYILGHTALLQSLSQASHELFYSFPSLNLFRKMARFQFNYNCFLKGYDFAANLLDPKVEWIEKFMNLKGKLTGISIINQNHLKANQWRFEKEFLQIISNNYQAMSQKLNDIEQNVIQYTKNNPACLQDKLVVVALNGLLADDNKSLPDYSFQPRKEYKRFFGNPKLITLGALVIVGSCLWTGIKLYNSYPQNESMQAYYTLLNLSHVPYSDSLMPCFNYNTYNPWGFRKEQPTKITVWAQGEAWDKFFGERHGYSDGFGTFNPPPFRYRDTRHGWSYWSSKSIDNWIEKFSSLNTINYTQLASEVIPFFNTTVSRGVNYICYPTSDYKDIFCYSAYTKDCVVDGGLCLEIIRGSAECAKTLIIDGWKSQRNTYYGLSCFFSFCYIVLCVMGFVL